MIFFQEYQELFYRRTIVKMSDLTFTDCLAEDPLYQDYDRMCTLFRHREDEMRAVHYEKDLVDVIVKMSHKLEEHINGMLVT